MIKSLSIKWSVVSVALLIFGACASSNINKIQVQSDCLKAYKGYWYNNKCWEFVDEAISKSDIDDIVKERMATFKKRRLKIGNVSYPLRSISFDETDDDTIDIFVLYQDKDKSKTFALYDVPMYKINYLFGRTVKREAKFFDDDIDSKKAKVTQSGRAVFGIDSNDQIDIKGEILSNITLANSTQFELTFNEQALALGTSTIEVVGNEAHLSGELGTMTYHQVKSLMANHPTIKTMVFRKVDGSVDNSVNIHTGRLLRENGFTTKLLEDSDIVSGGVDLFTAGRERIVTKGAKIGVHS